MSYACPWCQAKSFSFWQKQSLGPSRTLHCDKCKRKVSVCWQRAQMAAVPLLLLGFLGLLIGKFYFGTWPAVLLFGWVGVTAGLLITAPLYHLFVPLERQT
ncbi:MAG TPA: hypothetical protein VM122_10495 [Usitatibacter sp.]|nr:hypothetical protein [Usitatibacter sp.]